MTLTSDMFCGTSRNSTNKPPVIRHLDQNPAPQPLPNLAELQLIAISPGFARIRALSSSRAWLQLTYMKNMNQIASVKLAIMINLTILLFKNIAF